MTEAQEKILHETHGLAQKSYGSLLALIEDVKNNRASINDNGKHIRLLEGKVVTRTDCSASRGRCAAERIAERQQEDNAHRWAWSRGHKIMLIILGMLNFILGSGLIAKLAGWI